MSSFFLRTADLLRGRLGLGEPVPVRTARLLAFLLTVLVVYGLLYGATMGTFGGIRGERALQVVYSAVKVPLLLLVTFALSLPSFFVLNTILGVRADFPHVLRALVATQAGLTVILASLAPFTALWYVSGSEYEVALVFNAIMFGIASVAAQRMLRRAYRTLIARNPLHRTLLRIWLVIYAFVGIQMAWVLRPFIGTPRAGTTFFRQGAWGNAYVELAG